MGVRRPVCLLSFIFRLPNRTSPTRHRLPRIPLMVVIGCITGRCYSLKTRGCFTEEQGIRDPSVMQSRHDISPAQVLLYSSITEVLSQETRLFDTGFRTFPQIQNANDAADVLVSFSIRTRWCACDGGASTARLVMLRSSSAP